jgi:hypothetical protein
MRAVLSPTGISEQSMDSKHKKTTAELTALIMEEIRKHPECIASDDALILPHRANPRG